MGRKSFVDERDGNAIEAINKCRVDLAFQSLGIADHFD